MQILISPSLIIEIKRCASAAFDKSFKDKDDDYINIRYRIMKEEGVPVVGQRTDMQKELQRMAYYQCQSHSDEKKLTLLNKQELA